MRVIINTEADVLNPVVPEYPDSTKRAGASRVTIGVWTTVDATGKVTDLRITPGTSSGDPYLDRSAINAARYSTYVPKIKDCAPIFGSFMLYVTFNPDN